MNASNDGRDVIGVCLIVSVTRFVSGVIGRNAGSIERSTAEMAKLWRFVSFVTSGWIDRSGFFSRPRYVRFVSPVSAGGKAAIVLFARSTWRSETTLKNSGSAEMPLWWMTRTARRVRLLIGEGNVLKRFDERSSYR